MLNTDAFKQQLLHLRNELTHRIDEIKKDLHHEEDAVEKDFAEQATQLENNEVLSSLDDEARTTVMQINSALLRIEDGTYGICESCGDPINEDRLKAIPYAKYCIDCAEDLK